MGDRLGIHGAVDILAPLTDHLTIFLALTTDAVAGLPFI